MANKATATAEPKNYGSSLDLAKKSIDLVRKFLPLFALVWVIDLLGSIKPAEEPDLGAEGAMWSEALNVGPGALAAMLGGALIVFVILAFIYLFVSLMRLSLELRVSRSKTPKVNELVADAQKHFFPFVGVVILSAIIVLAGLVALILPGLYLLVRIIFAPYLLIDRNLGPTEAIKASWRMTDGRFGAAAGPLLVIIAVSIIATILLGWIPVVGGLLVIAASIAVSLTLPLRYVQIAKEVK